jgi:predicted RecA/RadA family phage recombinase
MVNPTALNFGSASITGAMPTLAVTVTNTGGQSAASLAAASDDGVYSIPSKTCSTSLAPGQSCMVDVQFCPNQTGASTAHLTITGTNAASSQSLLATVSLTGIGTP